MRYLGRVLLWVTVCLLCGACARAEEEADEVFEIDVAALQAAADEAGAPLDVGELLKAMMRGEVPFNMEAAGQFLSGIVREEVLGVRVQLLMLLAPALLWAVNRYLLGGGKLGETAGYVCFLSGASVLLNMVGGYIALTQQTIRRVSSLTTQFFPVLSGLMSVSGAAGSAASLQPAVTLLGGVLNVFLQRAAAVLCGSAAVIAVIGNLTDRIPLQSLFRFCCSVGTWLLGGIMAAFVALTGMCGIIGAGQNGIAMKAAKYAVGTLLPVVGGDIAGTMDVMVSSASAVRGAAGVTGVIVMLALCLRPVVRLTLGMLSCSLASALTEPVADGALRRCMEQMAQVVRLLLAASSANAAMFVVLAGAACR